MTKINIYDEFEAIGSLDRCFQMYEINRGKIIETMLVSTVLSSRKDGTGFRTKS